MLYRAIDQNETNNIKLIHDLTDDSTALSKQVDELTGQLRDVNDSIIKI
jgi:hypothetical protein